MLLSALIPPIAAATIVNVFLFAASWRAHQVELRTGKTPWPLQIGFIAYALCLGGFVYLTGDTPLRGGFSLLMAALAAQAGGGVIVYALLHAFLFSRGQRRRERAFAMGLALMLTGGMFAALFAT